MNCLPKTEYKFLIFNRLQVRIVCLSLECPNQKFFTLTIYRFAQFHGPTLNTASFAPISEFLIVVYTGFKLCRRD
jgi:hypothetical protein